MTQQYNPSTLNITPGLSVLKYTVKNQLESILRDVPKFNNLHIVAEHTETKKSNKGIYIAVKSRSKESTGIDGYGGVEKGFSMLTKIASTETPGTSIEWSSIDERFYDKSKMGQYFIVITDANTYSYLHVYPKKDILTEKHDGVTTTFTLSSLPTHPSTVRVTVDRIVLIRGVDFSVNGDQVILNKFIPAFLPIKAEYKVDGNSVSGLEYASNRISEIIPGVFIYFSNNIVIGDEMVLFLYDKERTNYHVYSSRGDFSLSLLFSLGDKKEEDELLDFLYPRIDLEMRSFFQNCGWVMKDLSYSDDDREEWDEGGYNSVSNSTIAMTVSMEWARFIPMVREFSGFSITSKCFVGNQE